MKKALLLVIITVLVTSCGEPTINGKIIDNFNKPVSDFDVSIKGTSLKTKTNSSGEYSIEFVPGSDIQISLTKNGYTNAGMSLNIATKDDYPAETINVYRVPSGEGIFFKDEDKNEYIQIQSVNITSESYNYSEWKTSHFRDRPVTFEGYNYYADFQPNEIPTFKSGKVQFFDTSPSSIALVKLEENANKYKILQISYPTDDYNSSYFRIWNEFNSNRISTNYERLNKINNDKTLGIRPYTLEEGFYAFYIHRPDSKYPIADDKVLAFRIE